MKYHRVTWKKIPTNMTYIYIYPDKNIFLLTYLFYLSLLYFTLLTAHFINHIFGTKAN